MFLIYISNIYLLQVWQITYSIIESCLIFKILLLNFSPISRPLFKLLVLFKFLVVFWIPYTINMFINSMYLLKKTKTQTGSGCWIVVGIYTRKRREYNHVWVPFFQKAILFKIFGKSESDWCLLNQGGGVPEEATRSGGPVGGGGGAGAPALLTQCQLLGGGTGPVREDTCTPMHPLPVAYGKSVY